MRSRLALLALLVGLTPHVQLAAQRDGAPITIGTTHAFRSTRLNAERRLFVSVPDDYARNAVARYPVLVLLDADDHFRGTVGIVRFFAQRGEMPNFIIVGVSNEGADRTRDFMPRSTTADSARFPTAGGADAFVAFLADELLPWAERRYRTQALHVLAGHSFGGVTALHAATTRPDAFRVTIAMSPSLWWNDTTAARTYADLVVADTAPRTLIVTSGGREAAIDRATVRFTEAVEPRRPGALAFRHLRFPTETHGTTPFVSLIDALRVAFAPLAVPLDSVSVALTRPAPKDSAAFAAARAAMEHRYAEQARRLQLPALLPEGVLNRFAYTTLQAGHQRLAVSWFRENTVRYPHSANTFDSLGDALEATGDRTGAIAAYRRSVEIAQRTGDPVGRTSQGKLTRLAVLSRVGR